MSEEPSKPSGWNEQQQQQARCQITELKARYCRFLDCKRWSDFADVFAPDGCMQFGPDITEGAVNGRAEIIDLLSDMLKKAQTVHHVHPGEFRFHDSGEVSALWPMDDRVANPGFVLEGSPYHGASAIISGATLWDDLKQVFGMDDSMLIVDETKREAESCS